jgi:hypothetical protein
VPTIVMPGTSRAIAHSASAWMIQTATKMLRQAAGFQQRTQCAVESRGRDPRARET